MLPSACEVKHWCTAGFTLITTVIDPFSFSNSVFTEDRSSSELNIQELKLRHDIQYMKLHCEESLIYSWKMLNDLTYLALHLKTLPQLSLSNTACKLSLS